MESNDKELSPQESLDLIRTMISNTKGSAADNSFYFLLWGWLVFSCCIAEYLLKIYAPDLPHGFVWFLMPLGGIISAVYGSRQAKNTRVKTFLDDAITYLWIALSFGFVVLIIINALGASQWQTSFTYYILLYAIGTFVTGNLIRFKPLVIGSVINFALAVVSVKVGPDYQLLIGALGVLVSYIIPGHLLKARFQKQNN